MYATTTRAVLAVALACAATVPAQQDGGGVVTDADDARRNRRFLVEVVPYVALPLSGIVRDRAGRFGVGVGIAPGYRFWPRSSVAISASHTYLAWRDEDGPPYETRSRNSLTDLRLLFTHQNALGASIGVSAGGLILHRVMDTWHYRQPNWRTRGGIVLGGNVGHPWKRGTVSLAATYYAVVVNATGDFRIGTGFYLALRIGYQAY